MRVTLAAMPARSIARAIADAAARWTDADFPPRVRALERICERTRYAIPVVEYALDRLFSSLDAGALEATAARELGAVDALDCFVQRRPGLRERAIPAGRVCVVSSRTTIGVAIVPAAFALLAKCDVVVKDRDDALVAAFFSTLAEEDPRFAEAAGAESWTGNERRLDDFDIVAAFGSDDTLTRLRTSLPARVAFIGYGSKASAGYVARDALDAPEGIDRLARAAARDLVLYESEGCSSLHALFVERGGNASPQDFAAALARAVERAAVEFPLPEREAGVAAGLAAARDLATFRVNQGAGTMHSDAHATYLIECDPVERRPPPFLPRALRIVTVGRPDDARTYLQHHGVPIEALAVAGHAPNIEELAAAVGAARIARFGELQSPPLEGRHGGRPRMAEFVRWIVDER